MRIEPGYYSYNIEVARLDDLADDSLFRTLEKAGKIDVIKNVYYQSGTKQWSLFHVPRELELGPIDSFVWISSFRQARADSKPEDTIPASELGSTSFPEAEVLEEVILEPVKEVKEAAKNAFKTAIPMVVCGLLVLLIVRGK